MIATVGICLFIGLYLFIAGVVAAIARKHHCDDVDALFMGILWPLMPIGFGLRLVWKLGARTSDWVFEILKAREAEREDDQRVQDEINRAVAEEEKRRRECAECEVARKAGDGAGGTYR